MKKYKILTGIMTTGTPHLGNYIGAIKSAIKVSKNNNIKSFFFLADLHALIKLYDSYKINRSLLEISATLLALGLNTKNTIFYRQLDVPEITEIMWILSCVCAKGLMNRAHAYKAAVINNKNLKYYDIDNKINMGLYNYPILMAADILLFNVNYVLVGIDQIQHIEIARDIAIRFNYIYNEKCFLLPKALINKNINLINGIDGQKMSKSYNNTIPIFCTELELKNYIRKIKTNSLAPGTPKNHNNCTLFEIFKAFANNNEINYLKNCYYEGISWIEIKILVFEYLNKILIEPRKKYNYLLNNPNYIQNLFKIGSEKARLEIAPLVYRLRNVTGLGNFKKN
ncbi:Tryptophanyl-tRNA synthetase [Candidatus Johnevansia muelleri]|uniref:Tryptophan--tRNA ligase n=1 Tax=Candidatus Johnevansia muelleri TaxID=1495769 RepID=A0A078KEF8_9GAMM|nr:Tryptophanyl-tRNA synthetase [Candidatus Evansia muelleri]